MCGETGEKLLSIEAAVRNNKLDGSTIPMPWTVLIEGGQTTLHNDARCPRTAPNRGSGGVRKAVELGQQTMGAACASKKKVVANLAGAMGDGTSSGDSCSDRFVACGSFLSPRQMQTRRGKLKGRRAVKGGSNLKSDNPAKGVQASKSRLPAWTSKRRTTPARSGTDSGLKALNSKPPWKRFSNSKKCSEVEGSRPGKELPKATTDVGTQISEAPQEFDRKSTGVASIICDLLEKGVPPDCVELLQAAQAVKQARKQPLGPPSGPKCLLCQTPLFRDCYTQTTPEDLSDEPDAVEWLRSLEIGGSASIQLTLTQTTSWSSLQGVLNQ